MDYRDLRTEKNAKISGVDVTYGLRAAELERASDLRTYVYSPMGAAVIVANQKFLAPRDSVIVLKEGVSGVVIPSDEGRLEHIVMRVPPTPPVITPEVATTLAELNGSYGTLDGSQWHAGIGEHLGGDLLILPKTLPDGKPIIGWPCNMHKMQPISMSAAQWTEVRKAEIYHFHRITDEIYGFLHGTARLLIDGEMMEFSPGEFVHVKPNEPHKVDSIAMGDLGLYVHLTFQYPPIPPEANDKVVVPE